jgi:hypothetical protein
MITYIDDSVYVELKADIATELLEAQAMDACWVEDEHGNLSYNEETQARFEDCYDSAEYLLYNLNIKPEAARHD